MDCTGQIWNYHQYLKTGKIVSCLIVKTTCAPILTFGISTSKLIETIPVILLVTQGVYRKSLPYGLEPKTRIVFVIKRHVGTLLVN